MGRWMDMARRWEEWENRQWSDEDKDHAETLPLEQPKSHQPASPDRELVSGMWVEFKSPLFGICTGFAELVHGDDVVIAHHSELKETVMVRAGSITKVFETPPLTFLGEEEN